MHKNVKQQKEFDRKVSWNKIIIIMNVSWQGGRLPDPSLKWTINNNVTMQVLIVIVNKSRKRKVKTKIKK